MLVNSRSARKCCSDCDSDFGKSRDAKGKAALKRTVRRRENREWRKDWK